MSKALAVLLELKDCSDSWCEYYVPLGIHARIDEAIEELLAQPEQTEPRSDAYMYNQLKEAYDGLVESSFKDFQRGFASALDLSVNVGIPKRDPLSDKDIAELWTNKSPMNEFECTRLVEKAHGITGGGE